MNANERRDDETDEDYACPHCQGQGQVFLNDDKPYLCVPCDGTGQIQRPPE